MQPLEARYTHTETDDECCRYPRLFETVRFLVKDKSETLSSICTPHARQDKDRKCFRFGQHSSGYCCANLGEIAAGSIAFQAGLDHVSALTWRLSRRDRKVSLSNAVPKFARRTV